MSLENSLTISDFYKWVKAPFPVMIKSYVCMLQIKIL